MIALGSCRLTFMTVEHGCGACGPSGLESSRGLDFQMRVRGGVDFDRIERNVFR